MSPLRTMASLVRPAALAALFLLVAGATQAAWYVKFDGVDGELVAESFEITIGDAPTAALLLPAVQKVRDAAARPDVPQMLCDGLLLIRYLTIEESSADGRRPTHRYVLENAMITSYALSGGGSEAPAEQVAFQYEKLHSTNLVTGETRSFDCSSGRCACAP